MKYNKNGFTLIELLAVITIMGILMLVSIPAVSRTIENTRRSTYVNTAKTYINEIKSAVASDELLLNSSGENISALGSGCYYYGFDSSQPSGQDLVEQGGKSPWGNIDIQGYILVKKDVGANGKTTYDYAIRMLDKNDSIRRGIAYPTIESNLTRSSVSSDHQSGYYLRKAPAANTSDVYPWESGKKVSTASGSNIVVCKELKLMD